MHYLLNKQKDTGRTTMKFAPIDLKVKFAGDSKFHLTNLLRNQPRLNKAANEAINESPELILEKAKPAVQQFFSKAFTEIANGVMKEAEEEEAFPLWLREFFFVVFSKSYEILNKQLNPTKMMFAQTGLVNQHSK